MTGARDRPDVYDTADFVCLQQCNKFIKRTRGMPDRQDGRGIFHLLLKCGVVTNLDVAAR